MTGLSDLQELVGRVRGARARRAIQESVNCYNANASKAAIVFAWLAVVNDFIEKLDQLALLGNQAARDDAEGYRQAQAQRNYRKCLDFENALIDRAGELELVSNVGAEQLKRLHADRHRCAHFSVGGDDEPFEPSPELARAHIHAAVTFLLAHAPAQGKVARSRLQELVLSNYFPNDVEGARKVLEHSPLRHATPATIKWFVKWLLTMAFDPKNDIDYFVTALAAARIDHRLVVENALGEYFGPFLRQTTDTNLDTAIGIVAADNDLWPFVPQDQEVRFKEYVRTRSETESADLWVANGIPELKNAVLDRVSRGELPLLLEMIREEPSKLYAGIALEQYRKATDFDGANAIGKGAIMPLIDHMTPQEILQILDIAKNNHQVAASFALPAILDQIRGKSPELNAAVEAAMPMITKLELRK